jgi:Tol biopolymer transport system component
MRNSAFRSLILLLAFQGAAACSREAPTLVSPGRPAGPVPPPAPTPPGVNTFPPLSKPGSIYDRVGGSSLPGRSRYVIYDDGTFSLQFAGADSGFGELLGHYLREPSPYSSGESSITFSFDASAGQWLATGVARGDSIVVRYNFVMALSDFEDGVFRLAAPLDGVARIYLANADGSAITRLTTGESPAWSWDGQRIAFARDGEIHLIDVDGSNDIRLGAGRFPTWSPDGKRIAFTNNEGIAIMNVDGSGVTTLIRHGFRTDTYAPWDMGVGTPAWSPDGSRIAFAHFGDGDTQPSQIYVMSADGSQPRRPTKSSDGRQAAESDPSWSPDGATIVFWSFDYGIASVAASGGQPSSVYANFPIVAFGAKPRWSPDGRSLAFTAYPISQAGPAIWIVSNGGVRTLTSAGADAAWSPRGGRIAFVSTSVK